MTLSTRVPPDVAANWRISYHLVACHFELSKHRLCQDAPILNGMLQTMRTLVDGWGSRRQLQAR